MADTNPPRERQSTIPNHKTTALRESNVQSEDVVTLATSTPTSMRCPDPSVHRTKDYLSEQASAAALSSTNPTKKTNVRNINPLGPNGRLSSTSAATSLKRAQAHELPSFPVIGIDTVTSANAAANLANMNKKSPEWWKPEKSAAAGRAALLATDYKMAPLWQPEASAAGSKAALLAHKGGSNLNLWQPEASAEGNSAATIAMKKQGLASAPDYGYTEDDRKKALIAATGAASSSGRRRAQSNPHPEPKYPDSENSARNALSAATIVHRQSMKARPQTNNLTISERYGSNAMEAARIQHSKASRDMYTEHPPVSTEVEEKARQDALRASAISMAKKMYDMQKDSMEQAAAGRSHAQAAAVEGQQRFPGHSTEADIKEQAMRYIGIQEAAQKLAAERLAKIGPDESAAFRSYYGYGGKTSRSKLSVRRGRPRASSNPEPADSDDDKFQSRRIRSQMSLFNKSLAEVDAKKREQDRKHLLAAAQRKVQAQMQGLDKEIYDKTGKMSPAMIDEWDAKARAKAAAASEARMENHGKIHIGNGKFMDQADIDAVALARIQPTLDEINEKTEKRRADEEERRLELEEKKREQQKEKERAAELKAEEKRYKDEEKKAAKARNVEEKAAAKQEKEAEREKKAEEKKLAKEESRKSKEAPRASDAIVAVDATTSTMEAPARTENAETAVENNEDLYRDPTPAGQASSEPEPISQPTSPTSPTSPTAKSESKGFKGFLSKFKRRSKHDSVITEADKPGFIGGAALNRASSSHSIHDSPSFSPHPGHLPETERHYSDVSSISSVHSEGVRGRTAGRTLAQETNMSAISGGIEFEEARDDFDEKLAPPPTFTSDVGNKGSPNRDSKFHEVGI